MKKDETWAQKIKRWVRHYPFMLYWTFYDLALGIYVKLAGIDYIGVYVKIMSPSEREFLFEEDVVGGGYNVIMIKVFFDEKWFTIESFTELVNHETLHQVVRKVGGWQATRMLDNVHRGLSYLPVDGKIRIWRIDFIF